MKFSYTRIAAGVLAALSHTAVSAGPADVLSPVDVVADAMPPAATGVFPEMSSPARESAELLRDVIGVSGSRLGGHGTDVSVRGQSQTRLNILLDGAYVHGGCPNRMDPPTAYAPPGAYEEITVIRGVQTLEYGGGGAGGTILFERRTEPFDGEERVRGELGAAYRANGGTTELDADLATGSVPGFVRFIGSRTDAGNYDDGDGNTVRSAYQEVSGTLIAGLTPDADSRFELSLEAQRTDDLLYAGAGMDSPKSDNDTVRLKFEKANLQGDWRSLKVELYRSDVEHVMDNYTLRTPPSATMLMRAPSTSETSGGRLVFERDSGLGIWKFGVDLQDNERVADRFNDFSGMRQSLLWPGVSIEQKGIFAELTHALASRDRLIAGLRYDRVDASAADAAVAAMGTSPNDLYTQYYGTVARPHDEDNIGGLLRYEHDLAGDHGTVYLGISRAMRTADATERYVASNGMPDARWVGNPNLDPERHHQAEVGLVWRGRGWQGDVSVYYNDVADYILRDRSHGVGGDNSTIYRNIDATLIGGEASLNHRFNAHWRGGLGLAYVWANNDTDDLPIAQTPPLEGVISLDYSASQWQFGGRVRAAARQTRADTDITVGSGLDAQETPAWAVLDLHGRYEVNDAVSVDFGVDNLFDRDYAQHLNRASAFDTTQVQVNEPGRSAWLKLTARF